MASIEELERRGWSTDVDERRARRPRQKIEPEDHAGSGGLSVSPAWYFGCQECGHKKRLATEDPKGITDCPECEELTVFEALGELVYPDEEGGS